MSVSRPELPNMPPPPGGATSLVDRMNLSVHFRRYFKLVARRWAILLVCVLGGLGYYSYKAFTSPFIYQSWSTLGFAPQVQTRLASRPQIIEEMSKYTENQIAIMTSSAVMDRVRERLALADPMALQSITSYGATPGSGSWFQMTVQAKDFASAQLFASNWPSAFIEYKEEKAFKVLGRSAVEIQTDLTNFEKKLSKVRADKEKFLEDHEIISVKETVKGAQGRLDSYIEELSSVTRQRELLEKSSPQDIASTPSLLGPTTSPPDRSKDQSTPSSQIDPNFKFTGNQYREVRLALSSKEGEFNRFTNSLRPAHPRMVELTREIADLNRRMESMLSLFEEEKIARIDSLKRTEGALERIIAEEAERVKTASALERRYDQFETDELQIQEQISTHSKALLGFDQTTIQEDQFEIRELAVGSPVPVAPNRPKLILTGLLLGLGVGIGIIYFLHRLDDRLELAADVEEALEEPVLGQIPFVARASTGGERLLITKLDQHDFFAESIRGIRSAVLFGAQSGPKQVLIATSAVPGDGKTTFTVNFAITLALAGHRVLLIDADMRRGSTHHFFNTSREPGLANILMGEIHWTDVAKATEVKGLEVIYSGPIPPNPGELLMSPITQELVEELRRNYDYVIFDCPPVTGIDDTFSFLGFSDGLLFVVRAGQTSMRFAKTALAAIRHRGARILGLVLNGITADNPHYYYYSYYNAYYTRNKPGEAKPLGGARTAGTRMAAPRNHVSIEDQAKAHAAQKAGILDLPEGSQSKTEFLRARRAAQQKAALSSPDDPSKANNGQVTAQPSPRSDLAEL